MVDSSSPLPFDVSAVLILLAGDLHFRKVVTLLGGLSGGLP